MDFEALLDQRQQSVAVKPRAVWDSLRKAPGYGYLRDVQGVVLTEWDSRRGENDIVLKVNTGGGKTIDGLVILQSYLNDGVAPALYVAPSNYLVQQVANEAAKLGIPTVTDPEDPRYIGGEAIGVININKLVNGRSVFSRAIRQRPIPIGAVVIDDAHAAVATARQALAASIPRTSDLYDKLLKLFRPTLEKTAPSDLLDIDSRSAGALVRVPFWSWREKEDEVRKLLQEHKQDAALLYTLPAFRDILELCRAVFTEREVAITPPFPPIHHIDAFVRAKHRVYLTATLADDSLLVTHFGAEPRSIRKPITPATAGDIGERMILAPQELSPHLILDDVRAAIAAMATDHNVVALVPSDKAKAPWVELGAQEVTKDALEGWVADAKDGKHFGLGVLVNKYDGIDLPDNACRVLAIDGLPEYTLPEDSLESRMREQEGADDRQLQRIEQGMGRAVRSNEDYCVVFLLGPRLSHLVADPRSRERFGVATRAQLDLARDVGKGLSGAPLAAIMKTAQQALHRDDGWVKLAKSYLAELEPPVGHVSDVEVARRTAFDLAAEGDFAAAAQQLHQATNDVDDTEVKGWLLEQKAMYQDRLNPAEAQAILAAARKLNRNVLRPLTGVTFQRRSLSVEQAKSAATYLTLRYSDARELRTAIEVLVEDLNFHESDKARALRAESAMAKLAEHIGLVAQRPDQEAGIGPDLVWSLGDLAFWVIELKTGAAGDRISKGDSGQLSQAMDWFAGQYDQSCTATPVMVHRSNQLTPEASAREGMLVIEEEQLQALRRAFSGYASGLAAADWSNTDEVNQLLIGHKLRASDLTTYTRAVRAGR